MAKIDLHNVSLTFTVHRQKRVTLKEYLVRGLFRLAVGESRRIGDFEIAMQVFD